MGPFPPGFMRFAAQHDGAEGWVGGAYLALWPMREWARFNELAATSTFAPGLSLFGTDGGTDAYAVQQGPSGPDLVVAPLVGLPTVSPTPLGRDLDGFLAALQADATVPPPPGGGGPLGMVIWEKQPIIFGGSPNDPSNRAWVTVEQAVTMAAWWNRRLADLATT